jgi:hypothetical protein
MSQVLQVTLTYNIPHMLNKSTGEKILTIPRSSMTLGLLDSIFTHTAPAIRRFPLQALPRAVREKISLKLDAGFELTLPENFSGDIVNIKVLENSAGAVFWLDSQREYQATTLNGKIVPGELVVRLTR